jgi:hypothetical protein
MPLRQSVVALGLRDPVWSKYPSEAAPPPHLHGNGATPHPIARGIAQAARGDVGIPREKEGLCLPLVISLTMVMLDIFARRQNPVTQQRQRLGERIAIA